MVSEGLLNFLRDISTDSELLARWKDNPAAVLERAGLAEHDKLLLTHRDESGLRSLLASLQQSAPNY